MLTAVVVAAGEGRRMGALGERFPKACLPVGTRPLIAQHLALLHGMGIEDVAVVVGFRADAVVSAAQRWAPKGTRLRFVHQAERRGIAHALSLCRGHVGEHFVLILGDTYFVPDDPRAALARLAGGGWAAVLSVRAVRDLELIRRECTVRFDEGGRLVQIQEKPAAPFNDLKPCGMYFFSRRVFDAIDRTPPSALRGEIEITDAIQTLVDLGEPVGRAPAVRFDVNLSFPSDLLLCNVVELRRRASAFLLGDRASVHPRAALREVAVGAGARIAAPASLERAVVFDGVVVDAPDPYRDCLIGAAGPISVRFEDPDLAWGAAS